MAPRLRTQRDVVKWIAIQTSVAVAATAPTSMAAAFWFLGGDLSHSVSGDRLMAYLFILTVLEAVVFTPPIALRSVGTLRTLNVMRDRLEQLASADPLTGLLNRRGFEEALAAQPRGGAMAALVCDLDRFKRVNDLHGHEFGDTVLRTAASLLGERAGQRPAALLARFGGEEFVITLPDTGREEARSWAETLRARFAELAIASPKGPFRATMSVGVAAVESFDGDIAPLLAQADEALYRAKREGRNRVATPVDRPPPQADAA